MAGATTVMTVACIQALRHCLDMWPYTPQVTHVPTKALGALQNRCLMPEGITPLALVCAPYRRSWWRRRFRLIAPSSSVPNPTSPPMLPLLLLRGTTILPLLLLKMLVYSISILSR